MRLIKLFPCSSRLVVRLAATLVAIGLGVCAYAFQAGPNPNPGSSPGISDTTAYRLFFLVLSKRPTQFDERRRQAYLAYYFSRNTHKDQGLTDDQINRVLAMIDSVAPQVAMLSQAASSSTPAQRTTTKKQLDQAITDAFTLLV